jgi:hypothetical protein
MQWCVDAFTFFSVPSNSDPRDTHMTPSEIGKIIRNNQIYAPQFKSTQSEVLASTNFLAEVQRESFASKVCEKLRFAIAHFDASLDADHEVGMCLVTFGQAITFHVEDVRYHNPNIIFFRGITPEGNRVQLIQHVSQISFLLMSMPKPNPNEPKRTFGFQPSEAEEESA